MTCIIGLVDQGTVYVGGDSTGANTDWQKYVHGDKKVFRVGNYIFGFTTSFRMGQIIQYDTVLPDPNCHSNDSHRFMVTQVIPAIRAALTKGGFTKKNNDVEEGGEFLVGVRFEDKDVLFHVFSDFQVQVPSEQMAACGCGAQFALGALEVLHDDAFHRIKQALYIAEKHSAGVGGPFTVMDMGRRS